MSCPRGCCSSYREHLLGVTINTSVASVRRQAERQESRDMDAFKRLVQSGVQPGKIDGSYELERGAEDKHEVERANIIVDPNLRKKVTRAFAEAPDPTVVPT